MGYSIELIFLLCLLVFIIGLLVGIFSIIFSTKRITKKDHKELSSFLAKKEERRRQLAKQAQALQNNY